MMHLGTRLEHIGSSLRVSRACQDGAREFARRLSGVAEKLAKSVSMIGAIELQPNDGPRSSLGIRPGSDIAMGPQWEFARRFAKGIEKLTGNTLGDRRKKTKRLIAGMPEAVGLMVVRY
ncbi:hypothetical protein GW17_00053363 [Ensete ventricosum]|nr:hypothetical protein GW17_00053363 [Ensete ventricosum]